jgi:hypothetical protein
MTKSTRVESGDVTDLVQLLAQAPAVAVVEARAIVKRGAQNIKTDAQRRIGRPKHAPAYPSAISYETHESPVHAWAEIGPDKNKRQGALGNILEFGSPTSAPHPHMAPAAEKELPRFERFLQDAAAKAAGDR